MLTDDDIEQIRGIVKDTIYEILDADETLRNIKVACEKPASLTGENQA